MDKSFELRETHIFPYASHDINNGGSTAGSLQKLRSNSMNFGSMRLDFDVNIYHTKEEGGEIAVIYLVPAGPTLRVRFELPALSADFDQKFDEGDYIYVNAKGGAFQYEGVVEWSDGQFLELALSAIPIGYNTSSNFFDQEVLFRNQTRVKSIDVKYNLSPSDKSSYSNGFDGGNMIMSCDIEDGVTKPMSTQTGNVKNWFLDSYSPFARLDSFKSDYHVPSSYPQIAAIQPIIVRGLPYVVPYWREDLENAYLDDVSPANFIGDKQLRMIVEIKCWKTTSRNHDPFTYQFDIDSDTGWYEENGNGGASQVELTSIDYTNVNKGVPEDGLDVTAINKFDIVLNRLSGLFTAANNIGVHLGSKRDFEDYNQGKQNHELTYLYSAAQSVADGVAYPSPNVAGKGEITSLQSVISNGGQTLTITGFHQSTAGSQALLDIGSPYLLSVGVYDGPNDQQIQLLVDDNVYTRYTDEEGLIDLVKARLFDPDADPLDIAADGYSNLSSWNEDGLSLGFLFKQLAASFGEVESVQFRLLSLRDGAQNGTTDFSDPEDFTIIQSYDLPLQKVANNSDGLPIYQGSDLREFNLDDDDPFKFVQIETTDNGVETDVKINVGFKVNWQYWNALKSVPDVFFNPADAHNGYNERTSNYSEKPTADPYNVKAALVVTCKNRLTPFSTEYVFLVPMINYDYGEDVHTRTGIAPDDYPDFSYEVFTQKVGGQDLNGKVLTGEPTVIKVHWINNGRDPYQSGLWFMTRLEEAGQTAYDNWELSTLRLPAQNNLLAPVDNEIALKIYPDGADGWWAECQTVPSRLDPNTEYKLSGRIGANENGAGLGFGYSLGFTDGFDA